MTHFNLIGHAIDHGNRPHLCTELSDAQFERVQDVMTRLEKRYGFDLNDAVMFCINLADKELKLEEDALRGMGKKIS